MRPSSENLTMVSNYVITSDNERITFDHYGRGHKKVLILAPGFFNSKQSVLFKEMAGALNEDFDVIVLDFRGHGKSSGMFCWTAKEHLDLLAVLEYAKERYAEIGVIGFSLGAAVSLIAAAQSRIMTSLIAVCAPTDFSKIDFRFLKMDFEENVLYNTVKEGRIGKGVRPGPLWLKKTRPIDAVSRIKVPVFFVHGQQDWLIKPWHSVALHEKANPPKRLEIIPDVTHAEYIFRRRRDPTISLFREWFKDTLILS